MSHHLSIKKCAFEGVSVSKKLFFVAEDSDLQDCTGKMVSGTRLQRESGVLVGSW